MIRIGSVLSQVGTKTVLTIQENFIFQRATFGCKIASGLEKCAKNIWNSEREKNWFESC